MTTITALTIEAEDVAAATSFYSEALGLPSVQVREPTAASSGFRGFTLSLITSQPGNAIALLDAAVAAGSHVLKPAKKSFWGFGGAVQAPDGTVIKVASSARKDTAPRSATFDSMVLLLGVDDMSTTKEFYGSRGFALAKNYGSKYAEFAGDGITLALYGRKAAAKDAGVAPEGAGSHRLAVHSTAGSFTDPDGFVWE